MMEQINIYCERLGPDFWAEPINAITNAAFLIAAAIAFRMWRRRTPDDWAALFLIIVVVAIGIGSFLFHTYATRWALLADVIPIAIFIHVYLMFALRRFLGLHWVISVAIMIGFLVLSPMFGEIWTPLVGGSASYLPALLAIFVIGGFFFARDRHFGAQVLAVGVVFVLSLVFRTIDVPACELVSVGTHFLWHILNAVVLFGLLRVLILHRSS